MNLAMAVCSLLGATVQDVGDLGPKVVQTREAVFAGQPSAIRGFLRKALYGEKVTVVALNPSKVYSQVRLSDGTAAWIASNALIVEEKFVPDPKTEEEKMRLKAQGYEAGRFDEGTEKKYKQDKGPATQKAYAHLDALEARPLYTAGRAEVGQRLANFRKLGKLGEFSSVK